MVRKSSPSVEPAGSSSARSSSAGAGGLLHRRLPEPPAALRKGPLREEAWRSPLRAERTAALLGMAVGIAFAVCFVTGLISHLIQNPPGWFWWPSRPVNLYRITQGLHVITGFAAIPLLLAKLWTVYPKLFEWPPARSVLHGIGRLSLLVLVGTAIFQLVTGVLNLARWYTVMPFFFTTTHYWTAWIAIGAILVHVGSKLAIIRIGLDSGANDSGADTVAGAGAGADADTGTSTGAGTRAKTGGTTVRPDATPDGDIEAPVPVPVGALSRRGFLTAVAATSGVVALTTAGQTVPILSGITVFGQRDLELGAQGLPVNKSAVSAGVEETALDPTYRLILQGPRPAELSLATLRSLPQHTVTLPITCVEGWSATAEWSGVRMSDLLDMMEVPEDGEVGIESLQEGGLYRASVLAPPHSRDSLTLLALRLNGEDLHVDHGYPARLIAPNRPGVLQTKWVRRVQAL